jgi:hypothetical protein
MRYFDSMLVPCERGVITDMTLRIHPQPPKALIFSTIYHLNHLHPTNTVLGHSTHNIHTS